MCNDLMLEIQLFVVDQIIQYFNGIVFDFFCLLNCQWFKDDMKGERDYVVKKVVFVNKFESE